MPGEVLNEYLTDVRGLVLAEIRQLVSGRRYQDVLYDLMLDYPLRAGKSLRPALCIAMCRALGGRLEDVLRTAAVIELYHNAFLIHDDIEDDSRTRRGQPTLHTAHGVPIAINVGDAMLAVAMQPLLDNARVLGLGKALRILELVCKMAIETVEGQALELDWTRRNLWRLRDADYFHLVYKKTCWYTFIAPALIGAIAANLPPERFARLRKLAIYLGVAFQIKDDLLNLEAGVAYGKDLGDDLREGKRTVILLHALRGATPAERERAEAILERPPGDKTSEEVTFLRRLIDARGSLDYARGVAERIARKADGVLDSVSAWMFPSIHLDFLRGLVSYVVSRDR
jgi:geranylgeranyl diphosphate synthase type II